MVITRTAIPLTFAIAKRAQSAQEYKIKCRYESCLRIRELQATLNAYITTPMEEPNPFPQTVS
jgi:hypothetical protein